VRDRGGSDPGEREGDSLIEPVDSSDVRLFDGFSRLANTRFVRAGWLRHCATGDSA
jgi:hypothetical protein